MTALLPVILPDWPAPASVLAFTTTVDGGVSLPPYASCNLCLHVGDERDAVAENRKRLHRYIGEHASLCWLDQTHSDIVINADTYQTVVEGDASYASLPHKACIAMTADCLPVLLCNRAGTRVAALHCGWQGLYKQLIQKTLMHHFSGDDVIAWLGPAIGPDSYEVSEELKHRFIDVDERHSEAFLDNRPGHCLMDLYAIARQQLVASGVGASSIFGGDYDTLTDSRFFSYRSNSQTGRMASVIMLTT